MRQQLDRVSARIDQAYGTMLELQLVAFDGRTPLVEFCRIAGSSFDEMIQRVDADILRAFERIEVTPTGEMEPVKA